VEGVAHSIGERIGTFARRLAVSDANDKNRLLKLATPHLGDDDTIQDLLSQLGAEGGQASEAFAAHELLDLLIRSDAGDHVVRDLVIVHETDIDAVLIEEGGSKGDPLQDELQVLDALAILLEGHGATVIDVDDDIVQG
jgi:hypothetical protein